MQKNKNVRGIALRIAFGITLVLIIFLVCEASAETSPIGFGETKFGRISSLSEMDTYTFSANAGDIVLIRMHAEWSAYPKINLYAANGSLIASSYSLGSFVELENTLPVVGIYKILVGDYYGSKQGNYSLYLDSINRLSCIKVTSPDGGENWVAGTNNVIKWVYSGSPGSYVKLELLKGGVSNRIIKSSTAISNGSFNWMIPSNQAYGTDYKVRITSTTKPAYSDSSNANFKINAPTTGIKVVTPNGGEKWQAGTKHVIKWTYSGSPGSSVKIELMKGGVLNRTINSSTSINKGSYNWTISSNQAYGTNYRVRITSTTNPAYIDSSNANFNITAPVPICRNSKIYGYSFNDKNSNKTKDKGESGLSNRVINLKGYDTCKGTLVSKLLKTNATGYYAFKSINPGVYVLSEDFVIGWLPTTDAAYTIAVSSYSMNIRRDFGNKKLI